MFIFSLICSGVTTASFVFFLSSATVQANPDAFSKLGGSAFGLLLTSIWAVSSWRGIKNAEPESDMDFRKKHRSVGLKAAIALSAAFIAAGIGGTMSGNRAAKQTALENLSKRAYELGMESRPIKEQFQALMSRDTPTMEAYLERCAELGPVNAQYRSALLKMDSLFAQLQPMLADESALTKVNAMCSILLKDLEATQLVEKETQLAKKLATLAPDAQYRYYKQQIQPIQDEESKIAAEEIALIAAAKGKGAWPSEQTTAK